MRNIWLWIVCVESIRFRHTPVRSPCKVLSPHRISPVRPKWQQRAFDPLIETKTMQNWFFCIFVFDTKTQNRWKSYITELAIIVEPKLTKHMQYLYSIYIYIHIYALSNSIDKVLSGRPTYMENIKEDNQNYKNNKIVYFSFQTVFGFWLWNLLIFLFYFLFFCKLVVS